MKRAQVIGISVAGSAGLLAFVLMQGIVRQPEPAEKTVEVEVKATEVLVARADIALGQRVNENLLKWQRWPEDAATAGYILRAASPNALTELSGSIARLAVMAGEPVNGQKLFKPKESGGVLSMILPAGMRAISTRIKDETAAGRLILPNDRVDVILIRRLQGRNGQEEFVSDTLFRNVRVLAIGQEIESKEGKKSAEANAGTATLELDPSQAEELARANSQGEISLSLRSIADLEADGTAPVSGTDIRKSKSTNAVRVLRYGIVTRAYGVN